MKRIFVYIIALVLSVVFVVSEHYYSLSLEDVVDINAFEAKRYLDTSDIDALLDIPADQEWIQSDPVIIDNPVINNVESPEVDNNLVNVDDEVISPSVIDDINGYTAISNGVNFTITNVQNDKNVISYTYKITIKNISGAYRYTIGSDTKYIIFSAMGEAELKLDSNQSVTIYDIPVGDSYKVEQIGGDSSKYTANANGVVGTVSNGRISGDMKIVFNNLLAVKEPTTEKNPYTADTYTLAIILFIIVLFIFIAIRFIKIERYE